MTKGNYAKIQDLTTENLIREYCSVSNKNVCINRNCWWTTIISTQTHKCVPPNSITPHPMPGMPGVGGPPPPPMPGMPGMGGPPTPPTPRCASDIITNAKNGKCPDGYYLYKDYNDGGLFCCKK